MNKSKKTVLITGGVKRIGKAIAEKFYNAGYQLKIHYNTSDQEAFSLADKFDAKIFCIDFANYTNYQFKEMLADTTVLINNASVYLTDKNPSYIQSKENDKMQMLVNYEVPVKLMELFNELNSVENMSIINILDAAVLQANSVYNSYTQSKFALFEATLTYAKKLAPKIRVNGVAPGTILPPSWISNGSMEKSMQQMLLNIPPTVEDIAKTCLFLSETYGITGEVITVDSGQNMQ